jgi:hypothetical protein
MTQRYARRLPNTSYGGHDANRAAEAGGMTLEELERCFIQSSSMIINKTGTCFGGNGVPCSGSTQ